MDLYFQEHDINPNSSDTRRRSPPALSPIDSTLEGIRRVPLFPGVERRGPGPIPNGSGGQAERASSIVHPPRSRVAEWFWDALFVSVHENASGGGPPPASEAEIRNLQQVTAKPPTQKVIGTCADGDSDEAGTEVSTSSCPVCTDDFDLQERVVRLPCGHEFHRDCVVAWLKRHCTCPVCRRELRTDDAEYENDKRRRKRDEAVSHLRNLIFN